MPVSPVQRAKRALVSLLLLLASGYQVFQGGMQLQKVHYGGTKVMHILSYEASSQTGSMC